MKKFIQIAGLILAVGLIGWLLWSRFQTGQSLEALDKDGNGVWDDVDQKILATFKHPTLRLAASKVAIQMQNGIVNPENAASIERNLSKSFGCFRYVKNKTEPTNQSSIITIRDMVLNSRAREMAWMQFNVKLSGGSYELAQEVKEDCDFDTSGL